MLLEESNRVGGGCGMLSLTCFHFICHCYSTKRMADFMPTCSAQGKRGLNLTSEPVLKGYKEPLCVLFCSGFFTDRSLSAYFN